ncbi:MAG: TonB-dependent receptor [Muribaculaceae bacterium]|nr:TonB-dependent receptor [Muribaculaceae bacterium]
MKKLFSQSLRLLAFTLCFCFALVASAQSLQVSGTVIDENGDPLVGATVAVKQHPSIAMATNLDGEFTLTVPSPDVDLLISYIGYAPQTVAVKGRSQVTVKMNPDDTMLDEVVVVGYGVQKKVSMTGSVSAVGSKELMKAPMQNVSNMLAGKVPGMASITQSGQPGADGAALYVRGASSFSHQGPLVLVDGVERDMNLVNPNDIEQISVLKDASSSIYGIKGSNGVILITTKSGQGKSTISYNMSLSAVRNTAFPELLNAKEAMYYKNKAREMDGLAPIFTADIQNKVLSNDPDSPWGQTDWADEIFRTGFTQQHNVSASGSTEKIKYFTSLGYMSQKGTIKSTEYERFNARTNLEAQVAKNLTFTTQVSGTKTQQDASGSNVFYRQSEFNPIRQLFDISPTIKKEWNGYPLAWKNGAGNCNPVAALEKQGYYRLDKWIFNSSYKLEYDLSDLWEPLKGLKVAAYFAYDYNHSESRELTTGYSVYAIDRETFEGAVTNAYGYGDESKKNFARISNNTWRWMLRPSISYMRDFGKHSVNFLFLYEKQKSYEDMLAAWGKDYISNYPVDITLAPERKEGVNEPQGHFQHKGMASYVGRINYAYDDKYLFEFAMRRDGSYIFAPQNRWSNFPSVSLGWVASRESFLKDVSWLDMVKLRASYGESGDDNMTAFMYNLYYSKANNSYVLNGNAISQYYTTNPYAFTNFTWAHKKTYNIGLDFAVLHNKLTGEIDAFYKKTTDILEAVSGVFPPSLAGFYPSWENSGAVDNRGVEIALNHTNAVTRDFSYHLRGSFAYNHSRVLKKKVTDNQPYYQSPIGQPVGARYGFKALGLFQTEEQILNYPESPSSDGKTRLGDIMYMDVNGDGIISQEHDFVRIGYGQVPEITFSFNIDLNYRDFYLTTLWQGATHVDYTLNGVYDNGTMASTAMTESFSSGNIPKYLVEDAWTPENTGARYPRLSTEGSWSNGWASDWWLVDGSYLRLKNIQIGYNVPSKVLTRTPFSSVNVYLAGSNVWTLTEFKYTDPESPSVSSGYYPQQATYSFGLNVTF